MRTFTNLHIHVHVHTFIATIVLKNFIILLKYITCMYEKVNHDQGAT